MRLAWDSQPRDLPRLWCSAMVRLLEEVGGGTNKRVEDSGGSGVTNKLNDETVTSLLGTMCFE